MNNKIKNQIKEIRDSGETNMMDTRRVQQIAFEKDFHELVLFIEKSPGQYFKYIVLGDNTKEGTSDD